MNWSTLSMLNASCYVTFLAEANNHFPVIGVISNLNNALFRSWVREEISMIFGQFFWVWAWILHQIGWKFDFEHLFAEIAYARNMCGVAEWLEHRISRMGKKCCRVSIPLQRFEPNSSQRYCQLSLYKKILLHKPLISWKVVPWY